MIILSILFFITAILYSSVGFGGGSTYLALLLLWNIPYYIFPVIALCCNIIVVSGNCFNYVKAGNLNIKLLFPYLIGSIPLAFFGGSLQIEKGFFEGKGGVNELMDAIFVDQLLNNKIAFISTYIRNFKNLSVGLNERPDFKHPKQEWLLENGYSKSIALLYECIVSVIVPSWTYSSFMLITLCVSALSVFLLPNFHTNLSREFVFVTICYIAVVSFFANPVARFLHPIILIYTLSNLLFLNNLSKMVIKRIRLIYQK